MNRFAARGPAAGEQRGGGVEADFVHGDTVGRELLASVRAEGGVDAAILRKNRRKAGQQQGGDAHRA